jgi:hypothetical protein
MLVVGWLKVLAELVGGEEQLRLKPKVTTVAIGLLCLSGIPLGGASLAEFFRRPRGMIDPSSLS